MGCSHVNCSENKSPEEKGRSGGRRSLSQILFHDGRVKLSRNWTCTKFKLEFLASPKILPISSSQMFLSQARCPSCCAKDSSSVPTPALRAFQSCEGARLISSCMRNPLQGYVSDTQPIPDKIQEPEKFNCDTSCFWEIHYTAISSWQLLAFKDWTTDMKERDLHAAT